MKRILFIIGLLAVFTAKTYSFAPPGGIDQPPRDLIKNIKDREIFKKSSISQSIKATPKPLKQEPKSFLSSIIKDLPEYDFELSRSEINNDIAIYHFQQHYKKLPVFGGEMIVRVSKKEGTVLLTGYFFKDIKTPVAPLYTPMTLINIAQKILNGGKPEGVAQLGILPADNGYYLCYKIRMIKGITEDFIFYMDALTGGVLRAFNRIDAVGRGQ